MTIAVIGGGIMGCLAAIDLELRGHRVILFEREQALMTGASRWNEGKLHLGYLFAKDPSLRTARTLIDGATRFAPLVRRYLERDIEFVSRSSGFVYAVHRDSMLSAGAVGAHLARVHDLVDEALAAGDRDYLGERRLKRPRPCAPGTFSLDEALIDSAYLTEEVSIDSAALAAAIVERINSAPRVQQLTGQMIAGIGRGDDGRFTLVEDSGVRHGPFDHVVNAAWDGRLALDKSLGYLPSSPWLHRLKVALHGQVGQQHSADLASVTFVLGPFGDVVLLGNGNLCLSWYPVGRIAAHGSVTPPPHGQDIEAARRNAIASKIFDRLSELVPALATVVSSADFILDGRYIFAWGRTDIDDIASRLHLRYDIGVHSDRGYHSIDTGKLTMAPVFAETVGHRIGTSSHQTLGRRSMS